MEKGRESGTSSAAYPTSIIRSQKACLERFEEGVKYKKKDRKPRRACKEGEVLMRMTMGRAAYRSDLTEKQWEMLKPLIPEPSLEGLYWLLGASVHKLAVCLSVLAPWSICTRMMRKKNELEAYER